MTTTSTAQLDEIWTGDHLGRREEAEYLTKYLCSRHKAKPDENGFVLAVNAEWGVGKSFMLSKWRDQLDFQQHPVVYFDAWSNDFTQEPLIAFIGALDEALEPYYAKLPKGEVARLEIMRTIKVAFKPSVKVLGQALAKHLLGMGLDKVQELYAADGGELEDEDDDDKGFDVKEIGKDLKDVVGTALKEHKTTKAAIKHFKEKMTALVKQLSVEANVQLPIFVFIDELDRCRPDYAIELLEGIKHLFGIPGLHFVIATNVTQLAHSVKAIYGDGFDGERYLKRFFDMEYALPRSDAFLFARQLLSKITVPDVNRQILEFVPAQVEVQQQDLLAYTFVRYAALFRLELRDQEQVVRMLEACFLSLNEGKVHIHFLMYLVMLYQRDSNVYRQFIRHWDVDAMNSIGSLLDRSRPEAALFRVYRTHNGTMPSRTIAEFSGSDITNEYFKLLRNRSVPQNITSDFPQNLIPEIYQDVTNGTLGRYVQLVQFAGRFSTKKPNT
ncbi:MAG: hypothetical protein JO142_11315 [Burkholderiales bacterium]|nr:hypothetical protein [Burkholderiales bacterium]